MATIKTAKRFTGPAWMDNAAGASIYVPPGTTAIATISVIKFMHIINPSAAAITFIMAIQVPGHSIAVYDRIFDAHSIAANSEFNHCCYYPILGGTPSLGTESLLAWASVLNTLVYTITGDFIEIS